MQSKGSWRPRCGESCECFTMHHDSMKLGEVYQIAGLVFSYWVILAVGCKDGFSSNVTRSSNTRKADEGMIQRHCL